MKTKLFVYIRQTFLLRVNCLPVMADFGRMPAMLPLGTAVDSRSIKTVSPPATAERTSRRRGTGVVDESMDWRKGEVMSSAMR